MEADLWKAYRNLFVKPVHAARLNQLHFKSPSIARTAETLLIMTSSRYQRRPAWQTMAGRLSRMFGAGYYDLFYGKKSLLSLTAPVHAGLALEIRMAEPGDLEEITRRQEGYSSALFDQYTTLGSDCYVAHHGGELQGFLWINRQSMQFLGMKLPQLPLGHCFVHSVFVFPAARRKGVFQFLFRTVCDELSKDGYQSICCLIDRMNFVSIQAFGNEGTRFRLAPILKLPGIRPILFYWTLS